MEPQPNNASWNLVYTKVNQELMAREQLNRQGYRVFLPLLAPPPRGRVKAPRALFPRYLFIHLEPGRDDWGPIRSTIGVTNLVRFGDMPARVPASLVEALLAKTDNNDVVPRAEASFRPGQAVRIIDGPVAGAQAIFAAEKSADRVLILLDLVGRETRLEIDRDLLVASEH